MPADMRSGPTRGTQSVSLGAGGMEHMGSGVRSGYRDTASASDIKRVTEALRRELGLRSTGTSRSLHPSTHLVREWRLCIPYALVEDLSRCFDCQSFEQIGRLLGWVRVPNLCFQRQCPVPECRFVQHPLYGVG